VLLKLSLHEYLSLAQALLKNPKAGAAYFHKFPPFLGPSAPHFKQGFRKIHAAASQTVRGGQAANVAAVDGSHYRIQLGYISNTIQASAGDGLGGFFTQTNETPAASVIQPKEFPQAKGSVRVYPMPGGKVGIIVDGSTENTELTINPLPLPIRKGYAHSYAYGNAGRVGILNIGQITINSGRIGAIEGFHTANLSGPIVASATTPVDRIAFNALLPGASIQTGGDLNTLDVLGGITLNTGTRINIGRDLNLLNVGQNIDLSNGSQLLIGRDLGIIPQPPKGTGTGSNVLTLNVNQIGTTFTGALPPQVSTFIQGDVNVGPGSVFAIGRNVDQAIFIQGSINGASRVVIPNSTVNPASNTLISLGTVTA
jgi:hypothetical protein